MADTLSVTYTLNLSWSHVNDLDLNDPADAGLFTFTDTLSTGTAVDQANMIWHDQRTVSAGANDDIDLAGSLTDGFGATITFTKIKGIFVQNTSTTVGDILTIGEDGANGFVTWLNAAADKVKINPGGMFALYDPSAAAYAVTASTGDILRITETGSSNAVTYNIILIGTV